MLFNSYSFLLLFVVAIAVSQFVPSWTVRKFLLLAISYVFYAAWNPPFVLLLVFSTLVDWHIARAMCRSQQQVVRKCLLILSLVINLGVLAFFKYGTFFLENFVALLSVFGFSFQPAMPSIILPMGISFYTFQTLSYTLDVYRRSLVPGRSLLDYSLYVTFFPQLVAGPIVRASDFIPQCLEAKTASTRQMGWGVQLIIIGLFNKVVIADNIMAGVAEAVFDSTHPLTVLDAWLGTLAFSIQIFCDFAGYSSCAIGAALCLGFVLTDNFKFPYGAIGFSDFWQRWHISLSTWLRDYLYISLGGNRKGPRRTYVNLMTTMLLGGLWHGASWLFVIWGGLHGLYLVLERWVVTRSFARWPLWKSLVGKMALIGLTYFAVCLTWVFFRAGNLARAGEVLGAMLGMDSRQPVPVDFPRILILLVLVINAATLFIHGINRGSSLEDRAAQCPPWLRMLLMAGMAFLTFLGFNGEDLAFIYFQF
jgi:alginate O-acetyltransferase complex protein AlgI